MSITLPLTVAQLSLGSSLAEIKRAVRDPANARRVTLDPLEFLTFQPKLESDWGPLHDGVPAFIAAVLEGRWTARPGQNAPSALLGDFGEFLIAKVYEQQFPNGARIARIIRAQDYSRPDFLVWEPNNNRLTALECKASGINGANLELSARRAANGRAAFNLCSLSKARRTKGEQQIGSTVVVQQRASASAPTGKHEVNYRESRVFAHRSVVGTMVLPDGRLRNNGTLGGLSVSQPWACGTTCTQCVAGVETIHVLFHQNSRTEVGPLAPPPERGEDVFEAYSKLERATWARSASLFVSGFEALTRATRARPRAREGAARVRDRIAALDLIATAIERGVLVPRDACEVLEGLEDDEPIVESAYRHHLEEKLQGPRPRADSSDHSQAEGPLIMRERPHRAAQIDALLADTPRNFRSWSRSFIDNQLRQPLALPVRIESGRELSERLHELHGSVEIVDQPSFRAHISVEPGTRLVVFSGASARRAYQVVQEFARDLEFRFIAEHGGEPDVRNGFIGFGPSRVRLLGEVRAVAHRSGLGFVRLETPSG